MLIDRLSYIVTGTGRCGTGYTSKLLTELGSPCGHEQVFGPFGIWSTEIEKYDGDSSWLAFPYLEHFENPIVHIVRDPLRVIRSKIATNWPLQKGSDAYWGRVALNIFPYDVDDILVYNMRFYCWLNRRIERFSGIRFMVEKFRNLMGVLDLCSVLNIDVTPIEARAAIQSVPPNSNQHVKSGPELRWSDLPDCKERDDCMRLSDDYGYRVKL